MLGNLKRTVQGWSQTRRKLKLRFNALNIRACEVCGSSYNLSFAHRVKRRFITTQEELENGCALLCQTDHDRLEFGDKNVMYAEITKIIEKRNGYN